MKELPTITIENKEYFIDERLSQIREISNPHNYDNVSPELIYYWLAHRIKKI